MSQLPDLITGSLHFDHRGLLISFNEFFMHEVKRMYAINPSPEIIRAWQGHRIEKKWFFCVQGEFEVKLIKLEDFESPSSQLYATTFFLKAQEPQVLFIPGGYANGFRATKDASQLLVFSNFSSKDSLNDDYRFEQNYWDVWGR